MPMSRFLPKTLRDLLVSAVTISFVANKNIRSVIPKAPNAVAVARVATVTVVVTVEINKLSSL